MAASNVWGDDDPTDGEWTTVTRSGLSNHSGPAGRYPNNNTAPAAPRRPAQAAPTAGEVAKGFSGLEIEDGSRKLDKYDIPVEVSGAGALVPANGFEEVGLVEAVLRNVARCGCDIPTTVQRYSMLIVLSRLDLMACAQTGSGMTAAFCLPMVSGLVAAAAAGGRGGGSGRGDREALDYDYYSRTARPRTLVLAPTRELAAQIHKEATKISHQTGIKIKVAYVGSPMFQQLRDIERSVDILVAAPRRPVDMIERSKVSLEAIKYLVIDEAHRMLDMGSDPLVRKIVDGMGMPQNSVRQMKLFSATFSPQIQLRDIGVDILVATPGRHVDMIERSKVSLEAIKYLVMDEADRMLDMGSDPQDRKIVDGMGMPRNSVRQTMLFSATFLPQIQRLASNFFSKYIFITVVRVGSSTDLITQKVEFDYNDYSRMARLRALVLVPARKFATQIHKEATKISHQTGIKIKVAYVGSPMFQQGINILVATPGRLVDMIERSKVSLEAIKYLVMDEADMMLDMGFDPQIRKIVDGMGIPRKSVRQTMLFIATFPPQMQRLASYFVSKYIFITVGRVGSNLITTQKVEFFTYDEKKPYLLDLQNRSLTSSDGMQPLTLVFVETKRDVDSSRYLLLYNKGFPATAIHGDRTQELRDIERGVDILVATPGRHVDMIERSKVSLEAIKYLVMDGAERMLDMGFDPHIRKIVDEMGMPRKSVRQTMLFSATFLPQIQRLASYFVSKYIFITVGRVGSSTDLIIKKVEFVTYYEKKPYLLDLLQNLSLTSSDGKQPLALVFVETKRDADSLRYWLLYNKGFPATAIHGDRTQEERERALRSFKSGLTPIMVATGVAARGLDVPSVSHVINYDLPKSIEDYVHMIGRTGRAGNAGCATAFFNEQNHPISKGQLELMAEAKQNVSGCLEDYPGPLEITSSRPIQGLVEVMDQKICLQFDSKLTIEEVVSKVFNNIGISFDYWVKINGRLAQLDCILSSLVPESDHDFSLYISPRMRGGAVRVPILDHIITFAENVFDVVLFPKELHYRDMTPYFLGLSSQSIEISVLLINLVHRKYPTRCPSHFTKEDILYNSKRNTVSFRADFEYLEYTDELYYQNLLDVATVFSEIFIYDENLLLSNSPAIHVHSPNILPTPLPHGWRRPMLFELLIHDLKQTVYQFVPLDISKNKDYFLSHLGILSDIARFAFLLSCELDLSYDGNEHNIEIFVGLRSEEQQDATVLEGGELRMEEDAEEWAGMEADAEEWAGMEEDAEEWAEMEDVEEWAENEEDAEEWAEIKEEEDRSESPPMLNRHTRFGSDDEEEDNEAEKEEVEEEADEEAKEAEKEVEEEAEKEVEEEAEKEEAKGSGKRKRKRKRKGGKRKKVRQEQGLPSNHIRVDNWFFKADQSDIFNLLLDGRYEFTRLGSQWRYSRNWVTHGFGYLETMEAKQAEAFLQLIFEGLFYNVRLKLHFPDVEVMWGSSPCRLPGNPRWSEDTAKIVRAWVRNRFTTCDHLKIRGHSSVGCMSIRH